MVLVRYRRAEQGEDAVSSGLDDVAVITAHGIDHELEDRIDDRTRLFRIKILLQPGRVYDVDEQCGDELPLALHHRRRFFCVRLSATLLVATFYFFGREGAAALIAEFRSRSIELAAFRALHAQWRAAGATELGSRWVVGTALRTMTHRRGRAPKRQSDYATEKVNLPDVRFIV